MFTYLKAPFPYFGGKATVADVVWKALGQPKHYIEPFFGSGAVLLNRPDYNPKIYTEESATVANDVREWCRKRGELKTYRIVLAGYYEEHASLISDGWTVHRWSAHGGFANRGKGKSQGEVNRHKEALFFSPHCYSEGLKRFFDVEA